MTTSSDDTGAPERTPTSGCPEKSVVHRYLDAALRPPAVVHTPPPDVGEFLHRMARNAADDSVAPNDSAVDPEPGGGPSAPPAGRTGRQLRADIVAVRRQEDPGAGPGRRRRSRQVRSRCAPTVLVLSLAVASVACAGVVAGVAASSWVPPVAANVFSVITATTLGVRTILRRRAPCERRGGAGRDAPEPSGPATFGPGVGDGLVSIYDQLRHELKVRPVPDAVDRVWIEPERVRPHDPSRSKVVVHYGGPAHVAAEASDYLRSPAATASWLDHLVDEYRRSNLRVSCDMSTADVSAERVCDLLNLAAFRSMHRSGESLPGEYVGRRSIVVADDSGNRPTVRTILLARLGSAVRERVGALNGERERPSDAGKFFVVFDHHAPILRSSTGCSRKVNILVWAYSDEWTVVREASGERTMFISSRAGVFSGTTDLAATAKVAAELMSVPDSSGQAGSSPGVDGLDSAIACR